MLADTLAHWIGGDGNWSDPAHWDIGVVPNNSGATTYAVVVDDPGAAPVITVDQGVAITSLTNTETLRFATGASAITSQLDNSGTIDVTAPSALTLSGAVTNSGAVTATGGTLQFSSATVTNTGRTITADGGLVEISGSTITGGTLLATNDPASDVRFTASGGLLDGVTASGDLDLATNSGANVHVVNGLTLNGTAWLGNEVGTTAGGLLFEGTQLFGGTGTIVFGTDSGNFLRTYNTTPNDPTATTLTIGPGLTVRGSSGTIGDGAQAATIINLGTITADASGGSSFSYDASAGYGFDSRVTTNTRSTIDTSGVEHPAPQAVYQSARTALGNFWPAGSQPFSYALANLTAGSSYTVRLHFAVLGDVATLPFDVLLNGAPQLTSFDIAAAAGGVKRAVVREFSGTADSDGKLTLLFTDPTSRPGNPQVNGIELLSGGTVVRAIDAGLVSSDTITINPASFLNQGQMLADSAGILTLDGAWTNRGTLAVSAAGASSPAGVFSTAGLTLVLSPPAALNLGGSFTTAGVGTLHGAGGTVNLVGQLNNTGATLGLDASTGSWNLAGGTIRGGTYTAADVAGLLFTSGGGTLDGLTANSDLDLTGNASVTVVDGLTLNANILLGNEAGSTSGSLSFQGTQTLTGNGAIVFGKSQSNYLRTYSYGQVPADMVLTIGPGITIRGSSGIIGDAYRPATIVNQGTIVADDSGGATRFAYDNSFSGNAVASTAAMVDTSGATNAAPQAVYQTMRYGRGYQNRPGSEPVSYTLAGLTPGADYLVRLHFATANPGQGPFDIILNDSVAISNFDVLAAAGGTNKAAVVELPALADDTGTIRLTLANHPGTYNTPFINGIELLSGGNVLRAINAGLLSGGRINIAPAVFRNEGELSASAGGETLALAGMWSNQAVIDDSAGATLELGGSVATTDLGTLHCADASVYVVGTIVNTNDTLTIDASTGSLYLYGTIVGGSIDMADGKKLIARGGTLDGVTLNGLLDLTAQYSNLTVIDGLTLNGTILMGSSNPYAFLSLSFIGTQTLGGNGTIAFSDVSSKNLIPSAGATLTIGPDITLTGPWASIGNSGASVVNRGLIVNNVPRSAIYTVGDFRNEGTLQAGSLAAIDLEGTWDNHGVIKLFDGTLDLGGLFHVANIGTIVPSPGVVQITGVLDNADTTLALDEATGSYWLAGGTVRGGTITTAGAARFIVASGVLDGVTINGAAASADLTSRMTITHGLTLNGVLTLGDPVKFTRAQLAFSGSQTLDGTGTVFFASSSDNGLIPDASTTLTIGPSITVHGGSGYVGNYNATTINRGTVSADTPGSVINLWGDWHNEGTLQASGSGALDANSPLRIDGLGRLAEPPSGQIILRGDLLGDTRNADQYAPRGEVQFAGGGTVASPQRLEVMGRDLGQAPAGFHSNFDYHTLTVAGTTYLLLVDLADNAAGAGDEAVYVDSLLVAAGATLDLNGLHLYARTSQIDGAITGGTVNQVSDGGPLSFATATPGNIATAGQLDEWSFFGRAGRTIGVLVDPGSSASSVAFVEATLLDAADRVLATASSTSAGAIASLDNMVLPADGTYRVRIRAAGGHTGNTGGYVITAYDVTPDVAPLAFNDTVTGAIENPFSVDRWTFSAAAGQSIQFRLINSSAPGLVFDLTGPTGAAVFTGLHGDSELITLSLSGPYVLAMHGTGGQTGAYAFELGANTPTDLTLGQPYVGTLVGSGQTQLFRVEVPIAAVLLVTLDDTTMADRNEVYLKFGSAPTRSDYDYRFSAPGANQELLVPRAATGTWYVLVYSETVRTASTFALTARAAALTVTSAVLERDDSGSDTVLRVTGAGFLPGTTVSYRGDDGELHPIDGVTIESITSLTVRPSLVVAQALGLDGCHISYFGTDVYFPVTLVTRVTGVSNFEPHLILPGAVRRNGIATLYVEYTNTGSTAMRAPVLVLQSGDPDNSDRPWLTLDASRIPPNYWTSAAPDGFSHTVQILASGHTPGMLFPGETGRVAVFYAGLQREWDLSDTAVEFELRTVSADDTATIPWDTLEADLRPSSAGLLGWHPIFTNLVSQIGPTWGDYVRMLDDNATYLGRLGEQVVDVGQLWAFEVEQANGLSPIGPIASVVDIALPTPGLTLSFGRVFSDSLASRDDFGLIGIGWSTPWETWLKEDADGSVTIIGAGGWRRRFQPDSRSAAYFPQAGDHATLISLGGGAFALRELSGLTTVFRADGRLDYVADTNGNRITAGYSGSELASLTHSAGPSLTFSYLRGVIETITASDGRAVHFTYGPPELSFADVRFIGDQHLIAVQGYDGQTTRYTYGEAFQTRICRGLTSIEFPDGTHQFLTYDGHARLASVARDGNAERVTFSYDSAGKVTITDAAGNASQLFFDHRGLLVKVEDPLGHITQSTFDSNFNLTRITDTTGAAQTYAYDDLGNVIAATDALGHTVQFTYGGPFNQLTSVATGRGSTTRYAYDTRGNLLSTTYPNNTVERLAYDALGNPLSFTNRRGQAIGYVYNSAGQITRQNFSDGAHNDFTYDSRGNLTSATDATGTTTFAYDSADRLTLVAYPTGRSLEYTYNAAGRRTQMVTHDSPAATPFIVNYAYDAVGRLAGLTDGSGGPIVTYTYDAVGRLSRKDQGNHTFTTFEYDEASQLLHLVNHAPDGSVNTCFDYTYDSLGRRTRMATLDGTWTYSYDATGQLTRAVFASTNPAIPSQDLTYVYDPLGNRIRTIENGVTTEYTTNNLNQYVVVGATTYRYDADGNLVSKTGGGDDTTYGYDAQNRLVSVVTAAGTWTYEYDAFGNGVATVHDGQRTDYLLDPTGFVDVVGEYDDSGNLVARYTHGLGLTSRVGADGSAAYYDFDAIGSAVGMTGIAGTSTPASVYLPFGEVLDTSGTSSNRFGYVGEFGVEDDAAGTFMRARYYQATLGRFVEQDPIGIEGGDHNFYRYATNNPISRIDPVGLLSMEQAKSIRTIGLAGLGVAAKLATAAGLISTPVGWFVTGGLFVIGTAGALGTLTAGINIPNPFHGSDNPGAGNFPTGATPGLPGLGGFPGMPRHFQLPPRFTGTTPPTPAGDGKTGDTGKMSIIVPRDPNDLIGPAGYGPENFIRPDVVFPYRIDFENEPTATAPAQEVVITDPLDAALDPAAFELTEIGFGDQIIAVPEHSQHFQTTVDMTYNGVSFQVQIEAGLHADTGEVFARFQSIDPNTSLPPDALIGFLPPEDGNGRGWGHVSYVIKPKPNLTTGTEIRNVALISFVGQPQIATNQVDPHDPEKGVDPSKEALNTIDAGAPTSQAGGAPARTFGPAFTVAWAGNDDAGGSGVAGYDVYYREDDPDGLVDDQYELWLQNTTATSAKFALGRPEHSYSFYTVATDNVGNREAAPVAADTLTLLETPVFRLGVAGDSLSDEYAEASYAYAKNWVELLAADVDVGPQGTWGAPRDEGFEYNWAQAGATSTTLLSDGQHTGLAQQIRDGLIDYGALAIGQNDFGPWTEAYLGIYSGTWSGTQIDAYVGQVVGNVETALETLLATGGKIVLSNVIDYGVAPLTRGFLPDPAKRELVTNVIRRVNGQLVVLAQQYGVPLIDSFQATKDFLGENQNPVATIPVGGVALANANGVEPQNMFVDDGIHPHTIGQAVIANLVVEAIHLGYGQNVGTLAFTEQEMLALVGLGAQYTGDTLNLNYPQYIILPGSVPGITVSAISRPTTEPNGTATFTVVLNARPVADVTIGLNSNDPGEGTVSVASVTFTAANWSTPQMVTVTGVDDDLDDGTVAYSIVTAPAVSIDGRYKGLDAVDVPVNNLDDDPYPWQNPRHWADVTGDGTIAPVDVLTIINDINANGIRPLPTPPPPGSRPPFLDSSGDSGITPVDALKVINDINANGIRPVPNEPPEGEDGGGTLGEGEAGTRWSEATGVAVGERDVLAVAWEGMGKSTRPPAVVPWVVRSARAWQPAAMNGAIVGLPGRSAARVGSETQPTGRGRADELFARADDLFELDDALAEIAPAVTAVWRKRA